MESNSSKGILRIRPRFKSLSTRIFTLFAALLLVSFSILFLFVRSQSENLNDNQAGGNLEKQAALAFTLFDRAYPGEWQISNGQLYKGPTLINDNFTLVDDVYEKTGLFMTVFQEDIRVATNVVTDGKRATGTKASEKVASTVFRQGERYLGEAIVATIDCMTFYEPIRNPQDQIVGMIFMGLPMDQTRAALTDMNTIMLGVMAGILLLSVVLTQVFAGTISKPIRSAEADASRLATGDVKFEVNTRAAARSDEIGRLARAIQSVLSSQREKAELANEISRGNLKISIEKKSDADLLAASMQKMVDSLRYMVEETGTLTHEAKSGNLGRRGQVERFEGVYLEIVVGINETLDAVTGPLQDAGQVLSRMAKSDLTKKMDETAYQGAYRVLAGQINTVSDLLMMIQNVLQQVSKGRFDDLDVLRKTTIDPNDKLAPAMIGMMETVRKIATETTHVADAARKGELSYQIDTKGYEGAFLDVVDGLNGALQAIDLPLREMGDVLGAMAKGDLTARMQKEYQGSYQGIKLAINSSLSSISDLMREITEASEQVEQSAVEIANGAMALSQGSTEQASSIEELSATVTEVASQTKRNAGNASKASQLAETAQQSAGKGNGQMTTMLTAMKQINDASANIAKIIKVIDDIAFQTNILALNAAVEAARAGQQGKGFAVVAEEVRSLAARSAEAAKETTAYIEETISRVADGSRIAEGTAQSLREIVDQVGHASELVDGIAIASNEQADGIYQINIGIEQVSRVVQTNSATSEESAAASGMLREQATRLNRMVSRFKL